MNIDFDKRRIIWRYEISQIVKMLGYGDEAAQKFYC